MTLFDILPLLSEEAPAPSTAQYIGAYLETFIVVHPLWLGTLLFALSWVLPRRTIDLTDSGERGPLLRGLSTLGPTVILVVALVVETFTTAFPLRFLSDQLATGWWFRAAVPLATALVLLAGAAVLSRSPQRIAAAPAISPRRVWTAFGPLPALWAGGIAVVLLVATSVWQGASPPEPKALPELVSGEMVTNHSVSAPPSGFGWISHAPTLAALALLLCGVIWALSINANRSFPSLDSDPWSTATRRLTARAFSWVALGGILLSLGIVWTNSWPPSSWATWVTAHDGTKGQFIGSDFWGTVQILRYSGGVAQAIGAALLMRLAVDTWRTNRALRRMRRADGADRATVLSEPEVRR